MATFARVRLFVRGWFVRGVFLLCSQLLEDFVILPNVLPMSLPFSLFARAWILSFVDWPMLSIVALLKRLSRRSKTLFILFCVVSGFCILKTLSSNDLKVGRWLCRCIGLETVHSLCLIRVFVFVGVAPTCTLGGICMKRYGVQ